MTILGFVVLGLATWRISHLFSKEAGPFHVFEKLRETSGIEHDIDGNVLVIPNKFFAELLSCIFCTSIWVGLCFGLFFAWTPSISLVVATPFALSAAAILADRLA